MPTVVGIDAPFGWPAPFVRSVQNWQEHRAWAEWDAPRNEGTATGQAPWDEPAEYLAYRVTDRFVRLWVRDQRKNREAWPGGISVAADRIAVTAFRAARVLSCCEGVALTGDKGPAVEVYPGAALAEWGFYKTYRSRESAAKDFIDKQLVPGLKRLTKTGAVDASRAIESLGQGDVGGLMRRRHHTFDAVVAAVTTWAAMVRETYPPPPTSDQDVCGFLDKESHWRSVLELGSATAEEIGREGWIHHPKSEPAVFLGKSPVEAVVARLGSRPKARRRR